MADAVLSTVSAEVYPESPPGALKLLVDTGLLLSREQNLDVILQATLQAGMQLTSARFGAFFYGSPVNASQRWEVRIAGTGAEESRLAPYAHPNDLLLNTLFGNGILRCADISTDAHFGRGTAFAPLTEGPHPVRSYFAIPVHNAHAELLGGLVFCHPTSHVFTPPIEPLVAAVTAQASVAMDNVRLQASLRQQAHETGTIRQVQRNMADELSRVLAATTDGIFLLDRDWRFTYLNPRAEEILSTGRSLLGLRVSEAFPGATSAFRQQYLDAMAGVAPAKFTEHYMPLDLWLSIKLNPTPEGLAVFFQDVTEERAIAREKVTADRRLRQTLDAAQLGTFSWDRATDMLDCDKRAAQLFHVEPHVPIGRSVLRESIVVEADRAQTADNLQVTLESGSLYNAEFRVLAPDGTQSWLATSGIPTYGEAGQGVTGMTGTVQDITPRKTQESALRQSEKLAATGRLAATIAHEINNPLEAVTNLIYLVKTDPTVPAPAQHLLETADQELARVAAIAQQTLGFYRDTTRPVNIDLSDLLRGVRDLFHRKLAYKKIECELDLSPSLHVFGLQGELRQVFSNLVVNAIDASFGGRILIRARPRIVGGKSGISVIVCDQGTGIPAAVRERLFSPFFTTKQSVGTGLGLWVTRGIVEKQGGTIRFRSRSEAPGGTIFRVFLPSVMQNLEMHAPLSNVLQ